MRIIVPGVTQTLSFSIRDTSGQLVDVTSPVVYFYDFAGTLKDSQTPTSPSTGKYSVNIKVSWDSGTYRSFVAGTHDGGTLVSDIISFHVKSYANLITYASIEDFIAFAQITNQITNGEISIQLVKDYLNTATERIDNYCSRKFYRYTITEERCPVECDTVIMLNEYPVISITSMTIKTDDVTTVGSIASTEYELDKNIGRLRFDDERTGEILVTYVAGSDTIPEPVHVCCLELAGYYLARRMKEGIKTETLLGYHYAFEDDAEEKILSSKLAGYRLVRFR